MNKKTFAGVALSALLAACGGGDGDLPAAQPSAQGLWQGRTSTGLNANVAVLADGEMWGVYGSNSVIYGAVHGRAHWGGDEFTGSATAFDTTAKALVPTTFSGSFAPGTTLAVSTSDDVRFAAVYHPDYDDAPSLANFAGAFRGQAVSPSSSPRYVSFTVAAAGDVTVAEAGCTGAGSVQPHASGKNIYDLAITFQGASCVTGDGSTVHGIAYYDSSTRQLLAMGLNPQQTDGFIYLGIK
jgi:hypothetical protein